MKFDRQKAFPYPVLRPDSDDYAGVEFQVTVDLSVGIDTICANIEYLVSCEEIRDEVLNGNAEFACIFSCRDTYYRQVVLTSEPQATIQFCNGDLRGEIKVDPYVVAKRSIPAFSSPDINAEFGSGPFSFRPGDILAQDQPQVFYIDRDMFKPVTSLFDLVKQDDLIDGEWKLGFGEDHVRIAVSPKMKESIDNARNSRSNRIILLNSLYFAAVMQTVQKLQDSPVDFEGLKWAEVIERQAHNKGCDLENDDAYLTSQQLMQHPLLQLKGLFPQGV